MKLEEVLIPDAHPQLVDHIEQVQDILNNGKYQMNVLSTIPSHTTEEGCSLFYASGTVRRFYAYLNGQWNYFGFLDSAGKILVDGEIEIGSVLRADATNGLWLGHSTYASAAFRVSLSGALIATSATITGAITASTGSIAGWTITSGLLSAGSGATSVGLSPSDYPFYAGASSPAYAPFSVTNAGALTASSGVIGGWTLGANALTYGAGSSAVGLEPGAWPFYAGSTTASVAPFRVNASGAVVCSAITIEGGIINASTVTAGTVQTSADPAANRVKMDANGLTGYDSSLGQTFKLPTDGSAPVFASGTILSATIIDTTIISNDFKTSSELPYIHLDNDGLSYVEAQAGDKYGAGAQYGDGTKYGTGISFYIGNSSKPVVSIEKERTLSDIRFYNRSGHSSGASILGDVEMVSTNLYLCTTAATPGTFSILYRAGGTDVAIADGGTGASLTNDPGGILYCGASNLTILANDAGSAKFLRCGATGAPAWDTVDIVNETNGTLTAARGGTGATAAANAANGVVVLNASADITAVMIPAGFAIIASGSYTGNATAGTAIAHGLGVKPSMVEIYSGREDASDHGLWITGMGANMVNLWGQQLRTTNSVPNATNFYLTATSANIVDITYYWVAYAANA